MPNNTITIEPIIRSLEKYSATSLKLFKLYLIDFTASIFAELVSKMIVLVLLVTCFLFFSIGIAIWLGLLFGGIHYGFFALSAFYLLLSLLFIVFKQFLIHHPAYNLIARKLKN